MCKREGQASVDRWTGEEKERVVQAEVRLVQRGILMASFTPQQPSVLPGHLSEPLVAADDHIDTC